MKKFDKTQNLAFICDFGESKEYEKHYDSENV